MSQQQTPSATGSDQTTGTVQVVLVDNDILALKMLREISVRVAARRHHLDRT